MHGYLFQCLYKTKSYTLNDYEAVSLIKETINLIFSIVAGSILFAFCFRLNIFSRFQSSSQKT